VKKRKYLAPLAAAIAMAAVTGLASASSTFSATGTGVFGAQLAAQATFQVTGDVLTITLTNIANNDNQTTDNQDSPGNTLSGVFFDIAGSPTLTAWSATVPGGSSITGAACDLGSCVGVTDVGGEWGFQSGPFSYLGVDGPNAMYGAASAGYLSTGLSGNIGNFNNNGTSGNLAGTNLDGQASLNGINFGLISSLDPSFNPNTGLATEPVIQDSVVLVLHGVSGIEESAIGNVSFQYGTGYDEPNIVPVPAAVWLFGSGLLGLIGISRRKKADQ